MSNVWRTFWKDQDQKQVTEDPVDPIVLSMNPPLILFLSKEESKKVKSIFFFFFQYKIKERKNTKFFKAD